LKIAFLSKNHGQRSHQIYLIFFFFTGHQDRCSSSPSIK
jgi:hypothetical protein